MISNTLGANAVILARGAKALHTVQAAWSMMLHDYGDGDSSDPYIETLSQTNSS
jgi:hypothetical protein